MQAIGAGYGAYLPQPNIHNRSVSLNPPQTEQPRVSVSKAKSTTALRAVAMADAESDSSFHTLQDPRTASTSDLSRKASSTSLQPGVDMEVAALSDKLISAINHQQQLDDSLAQTRHELEAARRKIEEFEMKEKERNEQKAQEKELRRQSMERMNAKFNLDLVEAQKQRRIAEQEKRGMEAELEALTQSLFEEANGMVAKANMEREAVDKKNQQLRDQIKDEEAVIASQKEQLTELKSLMQEIQGEHRKEISESPRVSSSSDSPKVDGEDINLTRLLEAMALEPRSADHTILPSPSTKFTHLLKPMCRIDVPAFDDFRNLLQTISPRSQNPSHPTSRAGSGSYGGLNVMGIGSIYNNSNSSSSPNLNSQATSKFSNPQQPPGSFSPNVDSKGPIPLKDTKFFKRIMIEDVEPTLRLDLSPTLSWLTKRSILSAFGDSTLMVEPIPEASVKLHGRYTPCSLCGENRKEAQNPRTHVMRVKEGEGATKWPICVLCLEKVRAVGDLVGYIRMVRDGVVKCGDHKEEEEVWEELVRLRERLFWARMAGGVVPAFLPSNKNSPLVDNKADVTPGENASGFVTPDATPRNSHEHEGENEATKIANLQLQAGLDDSLTTFDNAKEHAMKRASLQSANSTPPNTPPRKQRESAGFPKINIPKIPEGFWAGQVNTLH